MLRVSAACASCAYSHPLRWEEATAEAINGVARTLKIQGSARKRAVASTPSTDKRALVPRHRLAAVHLVAVQPQH